MPITPPRMSLILTTVIVFALAAQVSLRAHGDSAMFSSPTARPAAYSIIDERGVYEAHWDAHPYEVWPPPAIWNEMYLRVHQAKDLPRGGPWTFNWMTRRQPCFMASGDVPRFALVETPRSAELNPHFHIMGDLRLRVTAGGQAFWLDEKGSVTSRFYPWGTVHRVDLRPELSLTVEVTAFLASNSGVGVEVRAEGDAANPITAQVDVCCGGLVRKHINFFSEYFTMIPECEENDTIEADANGATLSDPEVMWSSRVASVPASAPRETLNSNDAEIRRRAVFGQPFDTASPQPASLRVLLWKTGDPAAPDLDPERFNAYLAEAKAYYENLLAPFDIETPDRVLNTAFYAGILNLDYTWQPPGWFEGIHEWNSYFCNNYQMSASLQLGWTDRAREALLGFGDRPEGPGYVYCADVSRDPTTADRSEESLAYYILQLHRYWRATGDMETVARVWDGTRRNLERVLTVHDREGNGLLGFHYGCNAFLYQADHLSLPGDAASPTIMVAHDLDLMAEMAEARGESGLATVWRRRAGFMRDAALDRLWHRESGRFLSAIDTQGMAHEANYYTDFVFPELYSSLPRGVRWTALRALDRRLWVGDHLMRVGNLGPDLFGNNGVQPVQMAEAAEAYFSAGREDRGWALLHGTARSVTELTDSPGSFPEFCSDTGWGLPDYAFGNPAGAYVQAVAGGLFGFEPMAEGQPIVWHPAIPAEWPRAALTLGDIRVEIEGTTAERTYRFASAASRAVECRLPTHGWRVESVTDSNGHPVDFEWEAHPSGGFVRLDLEPAEEHSFSVHSIPSGLTMRLPASVQPGDEIEWRLPREGLRIGDPQELFATFSIEGTLLRGRIAESVGPRVLVFTDAARREAVAIDVRVGPAPSPPQGFLRLEGRRESMDLTSHYNSAGVRERNAWRGGPQIIDMTGQLEMTDAESGWLDVGDTRFLVRPKRLNVVAIEMGELGHYDHRVQLSGHPPKQIFEVGQAVHGLEFLAASEGRTRLTGMVVGEVVLHYSEGARQRVSLVYGREIDCSLIPFATDVLVGRVHDFKNVSAFAVRADPARVLEKVEMHVSVFDLSIGLMGANIVLE